MTKYIWHRDTLELHSAPSCSSLRHIPPNKRKYEDEYPETHGLIKFKPCDECLRIAEEVTPSPSIS